MISAKEVYFEEDGWVSIWLGQIMGDPTEEFLVTQFGATDWDLDYRDCIVEEVLTPVASMISLLSYAESFLEPVMEAVSKRGLTKALRVLGQYNYNYDPVKAGLIVLPTEPLFLGSFEWHD